MNGMAHKRVWETPAGVRLCRLEEIEEPGARNFVVEIDDAHFHGFVVRKGGAIHGYVDRCPHQGLPLARKLDDYLTDRKDFIVCSWHGALFRPEDGACMGGPCSGTHLTSWPVRVDDGWLVTA